MYKHTCMYIHFKIIVIIIMIIMILMIPEDVTQILYLTLVITFKTLSLKQNEENIYF